MDILNLIWNQIKQWPPTGTTVMGVCLIMGAIDYLVRGNLTEAMTVAGILAALIPEDKAYIDKAEEILNTIANLEKDKAP